MHLIENKDDFFKALKDETVIVIVEGKKDKKTLLNHGIRSVTVQKSLLSFAENIAYKNNNVILLMDNDKKGVELTKRLKQIFERLGVKVNLRYWYALKRLKITHVEGL